jgi:hypothetical protein
MSMLKWKLFGRHFLSMDVMFDALFLLSRHDQDYKLRVPISALIDYKGFRCLAIGQIPILPQQGPSLGFYKGHYVPPEPELKSAFSHVGDILQLKDNEVFSTQNTMMQSVPVSYFAKIYSF